MLHCIAIIGLVDQFGGSFSRNVNSRLLYYHKGNSKIGTFCKKPKKYVLFWNCQYGVYEEIKIQNTGGISYAEQIISKSS